MLYHLIIIVSSLTLISFTMLCGQRLLIDQRPWSPTFSYCDYCRHRLTWWQLIPIVGYLIQFGNCHFCRQRINPINTWYELVVTLLIMPLVTNHPFRDCSLLIVMMTLVFLSTTDQQERFIYAWALPGLVALVPFRGTAWLFPLQWWKFSLLLGILLGLLIMTYLTKGLGSGDLEFIIIICACVGPVLTAWMIVYASLIVVGAVFCRLIKIDERIPFIPFLSLGLLITLLTN